MEAHTGGAPPHPVPPPPRGQAQARLERELTQGVSRLATEHVKHAPECLMSLEKLPAHGLSVNRLVRDPGSIRANSLVAELLPHPNLEIAREVQFYF